MAKKQKKAVPGKKGKRLGGVVKRAMKVPIQSYICPIYAPVI